MAILSVYDWQRMYKEKDLIFVHVVLRYKLILGTDLYNGNIWCIVIKWCHYFSTESCSKLAGQTPLLPDIGQCGTWSRLATYQYFGYRVWIRLHFNPAKVIWVNTVEILIFNLSAQGTLFPCNKIYHKMVSIKLLISKLLLSLSEQSVTSEVKRRCSTIAQMIHEKRQGIPKCYWCDWEYRAMPNISTLPIRGNWQSRTLVLKFSRDLSLGEFKCMLLASSNSYYI